MTDPEQRFLARLARIQLFLADGPAAMIALLARHGLAD
jgi:hypothetical protein